MRQLLILLVLLLFAAEAVAQDPSRRSGTGEGAYFGAPVVKYTAVRDQGVVMIGGRGGWNATPSLVLGGGLYGTVTEVDAPTGASSEAPGPLDVKLESFGFEVEYSPHPAAPTHLTLGAFLGGAAAHYVLDKNHDQHGETDFMLLIEPAVGVERKISDRVHLNLAASYRLVGGVELSLLGNDDFNGPAIALAAKIGRF
jgi:hypothetical protein